MVPTEVDEDTLTEIPVTALLVLEVPPFSGLTLSLFSAPTVALEPFCTWLWPGSLTLANEEVDAEADDGSVKFARLACATTLL